MVVLGWPGSSGAGSSARIFSARVAIINNKTWDLGAEGLRGIKVKHFIFLFFHSES